MSQIKKCWYTACIYTRRKVGLARTTAGMTYTCNYRHGWEQKSPTRRKQHAVVTITIHLQDGRDEVRLVKNWTVPLIVRRLRGTYLAVVGRKTEIRANEAGKEPLVFPAPSYVVHSKLVSRRIPQVFSNNTRKTCKGVFGIYGTYRWAYRTHPSVGYWY